MEFPLLPIPKPKIDQSLSGRSGFSKIRFPNHQRQVERLTPKFQRLQKALDRGDLFALRQDPAGIAPERALVFEIVGSIDQFYGAVSKIPGLEFIGEEDKIFEADEDFYIPDTRVKSEGDIQYDKPVGGRLYLAMPDVRALEELISLWELYKEEEVFPRGYAKWRYLFEKLHDIRAWGPQDRMPQKTVHYLMDNLALQTDLIRAECELWSYQSSDKNAKAREKFNRAVRESGGLIVHQSSIPAIAYEAALIDLPVSEVESLAQREPVKLLVCDELMMIRPQSDVTFPISISTADDMDHQPVEPMMIEADPIVGVLDGVPVQAHRLLDNRIDLDDPDDLQDISVVSKRHHGTQMALLIIHGDRNLTELPLRRLIYMRPVLAPGDDEVEQSQRDRLLVDTIYHAILRMKVGTNEEPATAPSVFIVNLSLGDRSRPFSGSISPFGRLLDYLAHKFGVLFIVSAGNVTFPLPIPDFRNSVEWENATLERREQAILKALGDNISPRTLLSPAEALNVITVGAWHEDTYHGAPQSRMAYRPYVEAGPNITSAMGLGHRKVIKPDIFMPGGREYIIIRSSGPEGLQVNPEDSGRFYGLKAAVPDEVGNLDKESLTSGTSAAAALATRAAHQLFEALIDNDNGSLLADADPSYYGVVVKSLLVHRARWDKTADVLRKIYGPIGQGRYVEYGDNIARIIGYGRPAVDEAMSCAVNRATLVGYDKISADGVAHLFKVPLPPSLENNPEFRSITMTLAWFSPVNVRSQIYRRARLEIKPDSFDQKLGVDRYKFQPSDKSVPRGSLFHVRYTGKKAVQFVDDGHMIFKVYCRGQGGPLDQAIKYGLAVTIEADEHIPVYQEIRQRLTIRPQIL